MCVSCSPAFHQATRQAAGTMGPGSCANVVHHLDSSWPGDVRRPDFLNQPFNYGTFHICWFAPSNYVVGRYTSLVGHQGHGPASVVRGSFVFCLRLAKEDCLWFLFVAEICSETFVLGVIYSHRLLFPSLFHRYFVADLSASNTQPKVSETCSRFPPQFFLKKLC